MRVRARRAALHYNLVINRASSPARGKISRLRPSDNEAMPTGVLDGNIDSNCSSVSACTCGAGETLGTTSATGASFVTSLLKNKTVTKATTASNPAPRFAIRQCRRAAQHPARRA